MFINVADRLNHTEEYYFSRKLKEIDAMNKAGANVINLGIGSPDLPPAPKVIDTLCEYAHQNNTHAYQNYRGIPELRNAMADWYKRYYAVTVNPETEVLPLIGSKEGIMHICMTYLQEGDEVLIPNPGYPTYSSAVRLTGATIRYYNLTEEGGWLPNLEQLESQDLSKVKLMWVNYPHMPTGTAAGEDLFKEMVEFAKRNRILLCHDNPYSFILNDKPESLLKYDPDKEVVIELNSLSKSANMAGWRIGMLTGHEDRIAEILRFKSNMDSGMFKPMQMAALKALELGPEWYGTLNKTYAKRREKAHQLLDMLNCGYTKDQVGMFIWAKVPEMDGYKLSDRILHGAAVFITPGGIFGSQGELYVRVSLCTTVEVFDQAIQRIQQALNL